jgi:hypothetical protein
MTGSSSVELQELEQDLMHARDGMSRDFVPVGRRGVGVSSVVVFGIDQT